MTFGASTTANIANATVTTLNVGGAATAVNIGSATGTTIVKNDLQVDGGDITFGALATANIANATVTTLNVGGTNGNVVIGNDLRINGNDIRSSTGNVAITMSDINVTIVGNLTIQGSTTNVGSQDLVVEDSIINLHTSANLVALTSDDGRDIGIKMHYFKTADKHAFLGWANDTGYLEYYSDGTETGGVFSGTYGTIKALGYISTVATGTAPFTVTSTTRVANLNVASSGTANTVVDAAQPNITSVGTLTSLGVNGTVTATTLVSNIATGTAPLTVTSTTQVANLNVATAGSLVNGNSNVTIVANANVNISSAGTANVLIIKSTGANVAGTLDISGVTTASRFVSNVATGTAPLTVTSTTQVANLNVATAGTAGTVTTAAQPNITSVGTLTSLGVSGTVTASTLVSNVATGTAPFTVTSTTQVANLNVATAGSATTAGTVTTAAQPNITSVGTLTSLGVSGTVTASTLVSNVATGTAPFTVTSTTQVANLNVATAGTVTTAAQPNITSVGTLTSLGVNGTVTATTLVSNIATGTAPFTVTSTTQVANLNVATAGTAGTVTTAAQPNITSFGNVTTANIGTIQSSATNGNITLTPNGTGNVIVSTGTATQVFYAGANKELTSNANLVFSGTQLTVTGTANVTTLNASNIQITGNTVASSDTNGNVNINANGTGSVKVNADGDNSNFIVYANTTTYTSGLIYAKSSSGQIGVLTETPTAGATLHINATNSMIIPVGTLLQRPTGAAGMIRFNTSSSVLEFHDGTGWHSTAGDFTVISYTNYTGDGSTLNFTLSTSSSTAATLVAINGVVQQPSTAYSVSGTTLTFTEAPLSTDSIDVRLLTTTTSVTTLSDGTTSFALSNVAATSTVTITGNTNTVFGNGKVTFSVPQVMDITGVSVGTSPTVIDTFPVATYRSAKYIIQVANAGRGDYESSEVIVVHNGTTAYRAAYGVVYSNVALGTTTVAISAGNVNVSFTGNYLGNTVKLFKQYIPV